MWSCPCGAEHRDKPYAYEAMELLRQAGYSEEIPVRVLELGCWSVPRLYILLHGLKGHELPELAARYGWAKAA